MCGINGFNFEDESLIREMNDAVKHRGPDGEGIFIDKVSLGHRRLAIIDLTENAKQPMSNESGDIWITFNGEIYNFLEIKEELAKNHTFKSQSDTEIIIHAYEEWGIDCVKKFNGMWAFCIYDKKKNILFLSRDRLGVKPLYYYTQKGIFIFSSEIKAILKHNVPKALNKKAVSSYLMYRHVLGEETFFENVLGLLPAHNLLFNLSDGKITKKEYWDLENNEEVISEEEAKEKVDNLLNRSIKYRKISDVPLGVILSGGLDSSLVTAILARSEKEPINTFTVQFKEKGFDETKYAKIVAERYNANYFDVTLDTSNFLQIMKEYTKYKDEPIGVPNEIALYLLSRKIKKRVTVVLSGEGADELFEGYGRMFSSPRDYSLLNKIKQSSNCIDLYKTKFSSLFDKYHGRFFNSELDHFLFRYNYWTKEEVESILLPDCYKDNSEIFIKLFAKFNMPYEKKISYVFLKSHLPGLLSRLDSATMASAIEGREPFLDTLLVQGAFNLPSHLKTKWKIGSAELSSLNKNADELSEEENTSKYILKEVGREYLPEEIVYRKKQGFPLPLQTWFESEFKTIAKDILLDPNAKIKEVINQEALSSWIEKHEERKFGQKLWMLLSLEIWLQTWF